MQSLQVKRKEMGGIPLVALVSSEKFQDEMNCDAHLLIYADGLATVKPTGDWVEKPTEEIKAKFNLQNNWFLCDDERIIINKTFSYFEYRCSAYKV